MVESDRVYQSEFSRSTNRLDHSNSGGGYVPQETIIESSTVDEETDTYQGSGLGKIKKREQPQSTKRRESQMKQEGQQSGSCCSGGN